MYFEELVETIFIVTFLSNWITFQQIWHFSRQHLLFRLKLIPIFIIRLAKLLPDLCIMIDSLEHILSEYLALVINDDMIETRWKHYDAHVVYKLEDGL